MVTMQVPFLDLRAQHEPLMPELVEAFRQVAPPMNPANSPNAANGHHAPPAGFGVDDAIFTLFRHKWLILAFVCLGLVGAVAVRFVRPPLYVSKPS